MPKNLTTEEFVKRARKVHGNKYDYSKVNYINSETKILIICKKHSDFKQSPFSHLSGVGCNKCAIEKRTFSIKKFIKKAKSIHGNKYNYSKTKYINSKIPVMIICPIHGEFIQDAMSHMRISGCPKCGILNCASNKKRFIKNAKKIHENKYTYSKVNYKNNITKIIITCPKHASLDIV